MWTSSSLELSQADLDLLRRAYKLGIEAEGINRYIGAMWIGVIFVFVIGGAALMMVGSSAANSWSALVFFVGLFVLLFAAIREALHDRGFRQEDPDLHRTVSMWTFSSQGNIRLQTAYRQAWLRYRLTGKAPWWACD